MCRLVKECSTRQHPSIKICLLGCVVCYRHGGNVLLCNIRSVFLGCVVCYRHGGNVLQCDTIQSRLVITGYFISKDHATNVDDCNSFNKDLLSWDVSLVDCVYQECSTKHHLSIKTCHVSSVTDMEAMFYLAPSFNQNLYAWGPRLSSNVSFFGSYELPFLLPAAHQNPIQTSFRLHVASFAM